ncbi:MAG: YihY/virulence factor BrkB family protein [Bacteroidales bacterium]|nr:YihY/virulence factor BrkB family protein [Bacteroidales bacterium]
MIVDIEKIKKQLTKAREWIINKLRLLILPGFQGMPLYDVLRYFLTGFTKGYIIDRGAAVAFYVFLAVFPAIMVLFTIIPLLPIEGLHGLIMDTLHDLLPAGAFDTMSGTINEILSHERNGLLSISAILAFYFSSSAFRAFFRGFDMGVIHLGKMSFIKKQLYSMLIAMIIGGMILFSMALFVVGSDILPWLFRNIGFDSKIIIFVIDVVRWLLMIFTLLAAVSILYYFGNPERKVVRFRLFTPGTILSVAMFIVGAFGFNFYITNFSRYNALYGSIGGIIIFMLWIQINCLFVLIGYELNASIQMASTAGMITEAKSRKILDDQQKKN